MLDRILHQLAFGCIQVLQIGVWVLSPPRKKTSDSLVERKIAWAHSASRCALETECFRWSTEEELFISETLSFRVSRFGKFIWPAVSGMLGRVRKVSGSAQKQIDIGRFAVAANSVVVRGESHISRRKRLKRCFPLIFLKGHSTMFQKDFDYYVLSSTKITIVDCERVFLARVGLYWQWWLRLLVKKAEGRHNENKGHQSNKPDQESMTLGKGFTKVDARWVMDS